MLETALGQVFRKSLPKIFQAVNPRVGWLPFGMLLGSFCVSLYYVVLISWSMLYLVYSFMAPLPWSHVEPDSGVFWDEVVLFLVRNSSLKQFWKLPAPSTVLAM